MAVDFLLARGGLVVWLRFTPDAGAAEGGVLARRVRRLCLVIGPDGRNTDQAVESRGRRGEEAGAAVVIPLDLDGTVSALMAGSRDEERPGAFQLFWKQFGKTNLAVGGVGSFIVAILIWKLLPQTPIPLWLVALIGLPTLLILISLAVALKDAALRISERPRSVIVAVVPPCAPFARSKCILIVEWSASAALPVGSGVTVSMAEQHHERALGIGTVRGIQADGKAQVTIDSAYEGADQTLKRLLEPSGADLVKQLRLGAQVLLQHIPGMEGSAVQPSPHSTGLDLLSTPDASAPTKAKP